LEENFDLESQSISHGTTPLILAVKENRYEILNMLLQNGANVDSKDSECQTALMHAAMIGCRKSLKILIENNADVSLTDKEGKTALMHAAIGLHFGVVEELLTKNSDNINVQDNEGNTALQYVAHNQIRSTNHFRIETARVLLKHGADTSLSFRDSPIFRIGACNLETLLEEVRLSHITETPQTTTNSQAEQITDSSKSKQCIIS